MAFLPNKRLNDDWSKTFPVTTSSHIWYVRVLGGNLNGWKSVFATTSIEGVHTCKYTHTPPQLTKHTSDNVTN